GEDEAAERDRDRRLVEAALDVEVQEPLRVQDLLAPKVRCDGVHADRGPGHVVARVERGQQRDLIGTSQDSWPTALGRPDRVDGAGRAYDGGAWGGGQS